MALIKHRTALLKERSREKELARQDAETWRSHGQNNDELVDNLQKNGMIRNARVADTMKKVDRANFCQINPYKDNAQCIGYGVSISAPHLHARALTVLADHLEEGCRALDVGSGSGYITACMALMVGQTGKVIGIDHIEELVEGSKANIRKGAATSHLLDSVQLEFVVGDGREGYNAWAPYDAIHVGAGAPSMPEALLSQLKPGGRMVVPVRQQYGWEILKQVDKGLDGTVTHTDMLAVSYVPLTSKDLQWPGHNARENM